LTAPPHRNNVPAMTAPFRTFASLLAPAGLLLALAGCQGPAPGVRTAPASAGAPSANPAVAVAAAAAALPTNDLPALVRMLGSENHREREAAQKELVVQWRKARPLLREAVSAGDPEVRMRARAILDEVKGVSNPNLHLEAAHSYLAQRQFNAAMQEFAEAVDLAPDKPEIYAQRAAAWGAQGAWTNAVEDLSRAITLAPQQLEPLILRAEVYDELAEHDKAIADYTRAIELTGDNADLYCGRGKSWTEKHDYAKATADFQRAMELNPDDPRPFLLRAWVWSEQEKYDDAIADASRAIEKDPEDVAAFLTRADALVMKGEHARAVDDYRAAVKDLGINVAVSTSFGCALFMTRQYDESRQVYSRALALKTDSPGKYNNVAWIQATCPFDNMRNGKAAVTNAWRACEGTKWTRADFTDTLAAACAEAGDFTNAVKYQEQAIKLLPVPRTDFRLRLSLFQKGIPFREGQTNEIPPKVEAVENPPAP
jgi:tetratricopeptide (TPR) repeat protein